MFFQLRGWGVRVCTLPGNSQNTLLFSKFLVFPGAGLWGAGLRQTRSCDLPVQLPGARLGRGSNGGGKGRRGRWGAGAANLATNVLPALL